MRSPGTNFSAAHVAESIGELRTWAEEEFRNSEPQWQELLGRSNADPLFMSWSWQWTWWSHHAALLNSKLWLIAAYSVDGKLVGLAPFHLRRAMHRKLLSAMRLETIGSTWRSTAGAYSEYLDFVVDPAFEEEFLEKLADRLLREHSWSDLIIANSKKQSLAVRFVRKYIDKRCYVREVDPVIAQLAPLLEDFAQYLQTLQADVRRKVWNQRARLSGAEFVCVEPGQIDSMFDVLNDFHERRWGSQLFHGSFRDFQLDFTRLCAQRGILRMSAVKLGDRPISVMYNVRIGTLEYNIQSGFDATIKGVSLGYLHFGFAIEQACRDGVKAFDFLAGDGRTRNYKQDFITQETELVTLHCIRAVALRWLYRVYDEGRSRKASTSPTVPAAPARLTAHRST